MSATVNGSKPKPRKEPSLAERAEMYRQALHVDMKMLKDLARRENRAMLTKRPVVTVGTVILTGFAAGIGIALILHRRSERAAAEAAPTIKKVSKVSGAINRLADIALAAYCRHNDDAECKKHKKAG